MPIEMRGLLEVTQFVDKLPETMFEQTEQIFRDRVFAAHKRITGNLKGGPMYSRSGLLRKSIKPEISGGSLEALRAGVSAGRYVNGIEIKYAPIHEYGGTVRAKRAYAGLPGGPYLNIPTSKNRTPAGVTRMSARDVFSVGGFIVKMKSGVFGVVDPNKGVMFTLHKQVKIKARLGMHKAMDNEIPTLLSQLQDMPL